MLSAERLRQKRTKREQRRKRLGPLHLREQAFLDRHRGTKKAAHLEVAIRRRKERIERKHHRPKGAS